MVRDRNPALLARRGEDPRDLPQVQSRLQARTSRGCLRRVDGSRCKLGDSRSAALWAASGDEKSPASGRVIFRCYREGSCSSRRVLRCLGATMRCATDVLCYHNAIENVGYRRLHGVRRRSCSRKAPLAPCTSVSTRTERRVRVRRFRDSVALHSHQPNGEHR